MATETQLDLDQFGGAPTVTADGLPTNCLSFTLRSDWGHFKRIDRTVTKQTYRIPPRTTIAGILAAIVGVERNEYYEIFKEDNSAIGIEPVAPIRSVTMPILALGTNPDDNSITTAGNSMRQKTVQVKYPESTAHRQRHTYEYLVNPAYRIDVAVEDNAFYQSLRTHLEEGTQHYPVAMGLSELLASITYHGEHNVTPLSETQLKQGTNGNNQDSVDVNSVAPKSCTRVLPGQGRTRFEKTPAFMEKRDGGRVTTGYVEYAFAEHDNQLTIGLPDDETVPIGTVGDRTVVFI